MTVINPKPTNDEIEIINAELVQGKDRYHDVDVPKNGDIVSPGDIDTLPFPVKGWALKGYNFRRNLRVFWGGNHNLTKTRKLLLAAGTGVTGGVIGWISGAWDYVGGLLG